MAAAPPMWKSMLLVTVMLLLGSHNTINMKLQFQTCVPTKDPKAKTDEKYRDGCPEGQTKYQHAWLNNFAMFIGEASLMVAYGISRRQHMRSARQVTSGAANEGFLSPSAQPKASNLVFAIPAGCDVFGSGLASVGLLYCDGAIYQMLRSAIIIFSAILSVTFLKKKLQPFHWVAVGVVCVALSLVGLASVLDQPATAQTSSGQRILGMSLIVGSQCISAFQMVFEEKLVAGTATSAKKVVGMEGLYGCFYMLVLLIIFTFVPGNDNGSYENFPSGVSEVFGVPALLILNVMFMFSIAGYNFVGLTIAKHMSTVVRCLVDSCRTVVVWGVNLFIYYQINEQYGSGWTKHSWLMAIGFVVLVIGTLMYNEVLPMPDSLKRHEAVQEGDIPRVQSGLDDVLTKSRIGVEDEEEFQQTGNASSVQCSESRA